MFSILALKIGSEGDQISSLIIGQNWKLDLARSCLILKARKSVVKNQDRFIFAFQAFFSKPNNWFLRTIINLKHNHKIDFYIK